VDAEAARIFAAVLAAGDASRFGSTKQLVELHGVPLVRRATDMAARVCGDRVVTVLGHDWPNVLAALGSAAGFLVLNENYREGMGTSIAAAARACTSLADALIVVLADQPLVSAEHLQALVNRWSGASDEVVASSYAGTMGPPVLFASDAFATLGSLRGDAGARAVLSDSRFRLSSVPFEPASVDIDTTADLAALT